MYIMQANFQPLRQLEPGIPVVAVDAAGAPVAIGTTLSIDPSQQPVDIQRFASLALDHSKQVGDYANILSTGLKIAADHWPDQAGALGNSATVVSFLATGLSFANEIDDGDGHKIAVAGFKFGANALALIDEMVLPGIPAIHISAQACKFASVVMSAKSQSAE